MNGFRLTLLVLLCPLLTVPGSAREIIVSPAGRDDGDGTARSPLQTIQAAAERAMPGDTITVREGVYRERVNPPRGGLSDDRRIVYQAAPGERVVITGAEHVTGWERGEHDTWRVVLPDSFFGDFNPFADEIRGDWFIPKNRKHHTGAVYLDGHWLREAASLEETLQPVGKHPLWFAKVEIEDNVVRNNRISHCEQAGIVGSLGAIFSRVTGNVIHDIHQQRRGQSRSVRGGQLIDRSMQ